MVGITGLGTKEVSRLARELVFFRSMKNEACSVDVNSVRDMPKPLLSDVARPLFYGLPF